MTNPQKQRFIHYYLYFRRYLSAKESFHLAKKKVPEFNLTINYLEQVRRSKKSNAKNKRARQTENMLGEFAQQRMSFWYRMWSKCGQRLFG